MVNANTKSSALRIIDASANRAMEGLRVCEEFTRMHLGDAFLSGKLKDLRHELGTTNSKYFADEPLSHRDILHDVGTKIQTETEYKRSNLSALVRANFGRTLQSLRSIEEYSKLICPESSQEFERIRYAVYGVEKAVVNSICSCDALVSVRLYVLTDCRDSIDQLQALVMSLIDAGVDMIQLRDKNADDEDLLRAGRMLTSLTRHTTARWIMNDRSDLAALCEADGVHVGQDDIDVASARRIVGADKLVGVSTHDLEQAKAASMNGANYIGVGPVFASQTKSFDQFVDNQFIANVVSHISIPAFAIGGICEANLSSLLEAGITRIAVSNSVVEAEDPGREVVRLKQLLFHEALTEANERP